MVQDFDPAQATNTSENMEQATIGKRDLGLEEL